MGLAGDEAIASVLSWWAEAGVDTLVDETPRHWLTEARAPAAARPSAEPAAPALPETLNAFLAWRMEATDVPEATHGGRRVAPLGNVASGLMIVVDQPAEDEMFEPAEARLFDRMLAAIGRDRASVYCAPFSHVRMLVQPAPADTARLADLMRHHIGLAAPRAVWLMGDATSRWLLGTGKSEGRQSLHAVNHSGGTVTAIATRHPRFLLERPAMKAGVWVDLQLLQGELS